MVGEAVPTSVLTGWRMVSESVGETPIEALDHAVCLRPIGLGEFVFDPVGLADLVEEVFAGSFIERSPISDCRSRNIKGNTYN